MTDQPHTSGPPTGAVYVVDDDGSVRASLEFLLEQMGYEPHGFDSAEALLSQLPQIRPGCFVCDVGLPGLSGLELLERLREAGCPCPVIMTSGLDSIPNVRQAFSSGALTFLPKPLNPEELRKALAESFALLPERVEIYDAVRASRQLSPRERQVFDEICDGRTSGEIAAGLGISERTVEAYRRGIHEKLQAPNIADLVRLRHLARIGESEFAPRSELLKFA